VSRPKLRVSTNFIIFGPTYQKLWVFEVFGQGLVRAGMCWSQPARVDYLHKKWRVKKKKFKKKGIVCPLSKRQPHGCHADVFRRTDGRTDDRTMAAGASMT
jgi:hypothetical protein